jgi:signal transduction histidine kinase
MWRGISLANKCLLLFGGAIVLIVLAALSIPFLRMNALVDESQLDLCRQQVEVWQRLDQQGDPALPVTGESGPTGELEHAGIRARKLALPAARASDSPFVQLALAAFTRDQTRGDYVRATWSGITRQYRYARAVREPGPVSTLLGVIVLERRDFETTRLLLTNSAYLFGAGLFVLGLATLVFYLITHQLILDPVRALKETAERVREGDLDIRSDISTGDEFEELSHTFNGMLSEITRSQEQLRAINSALDVKLNELAESNSALYEAARLKGEFLASISHELRTPLNSIIGFTDLLRDAAQSELNAGDDSTRLTKRLRYLENISTASRNLLEMISSLLEMAKIEAGRVDLSIAPVNIADTCQGLLAMIAVQAEKKSIDLKFECEGEFPPVRTDATKLQQIVLNFLSNAVKFTPSLDPAGRPGVVTLRVDRLAPSGVEGPGAEDRIRISVLDTGPGISAEDQTRLFQKFTQLDAGLARGHAGTGLGLAISRELAHVLQGEIQLVSEPGRGSMFSLILPVTFDPARHKEHKLEASLRAALAGRRVAVV